MEPSQSIFESLAEYANQQDSLPPVEQWNPDHCGEIDIRIKADGEWLHNGSPITRKKMVNLFSKILINQENRYFLVTPVEKVSIQVDWQPFVIVDFEVRTDSNQGYFVFKDNCDNQIPLSSKQQLEFSEYQGQSLPIINVRRNLFASFSRSCYYRLIEQAKMISRDQHDCLQIVSAGVEFELGRIDR